MAFGGAAAVPSMPRAAWLPAAVSAANIPLHRRLIASFRTTLPSGEKAWRLIVQQHGADIITSILRVDGDTRSADRKLAGRQVCGEATSMAHVRGCI